MGTAEKWQDRVVKMLNDTNVIILNPRRDDWDWTWEQSINNPKFKEQVEWELDNILHSDIVLVYFDKNAKSPITLLELGLISEQELGYIKDVIVVCPEGFWRKGNVDIICEIYGHTVKNTLEEAVEEIRRKI